MGQGDFGARSMPTSPALQAHRAQQQQQLAQQTRVQPQPVNTDPSFWAGQAGVDIGKWMQDRTQRAPGTPLQPGEQMSSRAQLGTNNFYDPMAALRAIRGF
jgi:hypothetical protein